MMMDTISEIATLLQAFQKGYTRRDVSQVDAFMDLFTDDCEVIGTNGIKPGVNFSFPTVYFPDVRILEDD